MHKTLSAGSFYGKTTLRREVAGLVFAESVYREELNIPRHEHAHAFLNLVLEGSYTEVCGTHASTRGPSTLALHPCGEVHADHWHGPGGRVFHVEISSSWRARVGAHSAVLDAPADFKDGLTIWLARRLYREYLRDDDASPLAIEGLAFELFAECSRHVEGVVERIARDGLRPGARSAPLLREPGHDVIAEAGVHPVHLASSIPPALWLHLANSSASA